MEIQDRKTSADEFKQLIIDYRAGDKDALETIVQNSSGMVERMSHKYYNLAKLKYIPIEDLKQECYIGLLGAVAHFPVDIPDNDFVSFAFSSMNYQMLIYIRNNSNRIVKSDYSKGSVELESMDKEQCSFAELADEKQELMFKTVEDAIDQEKLHQDIEEMMNDILQGENIELLKDMYGLHGQSYSWNEICDKHNLTFKDMLIQERRMILQVRNSEKIREYKYNFDYHCSLAFKYGVEKFKNTWTSSTEHLAIQHLER